MGEKTQKIQQRKREAVREIKEFIQRSPSLIFTDYRGLNVAQITELRRTLRREKAEYKVVKNNYAKIALRELGMPFEEAFLDDPTAIAMTRADIGPIAKALFEFTKDSPLKVKGGLIDGQALKTASVEAISRLPGRQELLAMLMGVLNAPVRNLMHVLNGVTSKLARTLKAVAEKKEKDGK
jgi:large subunit ribosomal protein L10